MIYLQVQIPLESIVFLLAISSRVTRQSNLLHLPRVRTEIAKRSFYYNGCKIYNAKSKCNLAT